MCEHVTVSSHTQTHTQRNRAVPAKWACTFSFAACFVKVILMLALANGFCACYSPMMMTTTWTRTMTAALPSTLVSFENYACELSLELRSYATHTATLLLRTFLAFSLRVVHALIGTHTHHCTLPFALNYMGESNNDVEAYIDGHRHGELTTVVSIISDRSLLRGHSPHSSCGNFMADANELIPERMPFGDTKSFKEHIYAQPNIQMGTKIETFSAAGSWIFLMQTT